MKSNNNIIGSSLAEAGAGLSRSLSNLFTETHKTAASQLGEATKDAQKQIFAISGELQEGDEITLGETKQSDTEVKKTVSAEHQAYFRDIVEAPLRKEREDRQELKVQIEEIRIEIKKLKDASAEMDIVFREVTSQGTPEKPGKYHITFYEWVYLTIRNAREKMEEVNTLGSLVSNRKKEKQYMAMSKKHGTSFSQNNERSIVRQTG